MSHFSCIVFCNDPSEVESKMAPFHQFECTGIDDEYVKDYDITDEALRIYDSKAASDKYTNAIDYIPDYYGYKVLNYNESPDISHKHKYGYIL